MILEIADGSIGRVGAPLIKVDCMLRHDDLRNDEMNEEVATYREFLAKATGELDRSSSESFIIAAVVFVGC